MRGRSDAGTRDIERRKSSKPHSFRPSDEVEDKRESTGICGMSMTRAVLVLSKSYHRLSF